MQSSCSTCTWKLPGQWPGNVLKGICCHRDWIHNLHFLRCILRLVIPLGYPLRIKRRVTCKSIMSGTKSLFSGKLVSLFSWHCHNNCESEGLERSMQRRWFILKTFYQASDTLPAPLKSLIYSYVCYEKFFLKNNMFSGIFYFYFFIGILLEK